ncbi:MAG: pilus assembly PilX N-terminal domain-containing protein [Candidatus Rokubacteria bacterium]|nr:pilus assembly PilX N-terminal domain-containing protein [Candidatus Rokubacteria bacterium]
MTPIRGRQHRPAIRMADRFGERGVALPMALILLVVLSTMAAAVLAVGTSETNIASNLVRSAQALYMAEAGIEAAFAAINVDPTSILAGAPATLTNYAVASPGAPLATYGNYAVQYRAVGAAGSNTVEVVATGTTSNTGLGRATRTIRAFMTNTYTAVDAVRSDQGMQISGNAAVSGACGSVHSNAGLQFQGSSSTIAVNATSTGTVSTSGSSSPTIGGTQISGVPRRPVPPISAASALTAAETQAKNAYSAGATPPNIYLLNADGTIQQSSVSGSPPVVTYATIAGPLSNNGTWDNLKYRQPSGPNPATWEAGLTPGGAAPTISGIFYVTGNAAVKSGGSWTATVIATGDIDVTGSPTITSVLTDTIFVAGDDIDVSGSPTLQDGIMAAHDDVEISGSPTMTGYIVAEGTVDISGNPTITFGCGMNPPLTGSLWIIGWGY